MMHPALDIDLFATSASPQCGQPIQNSGERTDEAKAREDLKGGGSLIDTLSTERIDHRFVDQAGVGSERSSSPEAVSEALERILAEVLSFPPIIELDELPSFLTAPRAEYLGMIERGAE